MYASQSRFMNRTGMKPSGRAGGVDVRSPRVSGPRKKLAAKNLAKRITTELCRAAFYGKTPETSLVYPGDPAKWRAAAQKLSATNPKGKSRHGIKSKRRR